MGKLINRLFEKDLVIKILSVLMAILIWFVVLDTDNPFDKRTISVPLTSNVDILQSNSFQIVGTPLPTSIDVEIKGRKQKIAGVTSNDFRVSVDFSDVSEPGYKRIDINEPEYLGDQDIIIVGMNPPTINLNFERIVGKQYPIEVQFLGSLPSGYEIVDLKVEPNIVILEEKESSISQVSRIVVYVNLEEADNNTELVIRGTVLDANGEHLRQFDGKVPVIVTYNLAKSVPLITNTTGKPMDDYYLKEIKHSIPNVRIVGNRSLLEGIKTLNSEAIDIKDKSETFVAHLSFNLPKGATLLEADSDRLTAEIIIEKYITKEITIPTSAISIMPGNVIDKMDYKIAGDNVSIVIKGEARDLSTVKASDIKLSIQTNNLEPGEHEIPLTVRVPNKTIVIGEYSVNLVVTSIPDDDPVIPETPVD